MVYRVLIVEDDEGIASAIKEKLEVWNFKVVCVEDFRNVLADFAKVSPHIVLLDISLPFFGGYHWCSEIRKISKVPIVFISSASDNMNIVMAMDMGGDDFIAKPFDLTVLVAKIRALLRRAYDFAVSDVVEHNGVQLNLSDASLVYRGEKTELTKNEFRILQTLMENSGKIVSRDTLMSRLWETDCYIDENALSVNISRLRKKLENAGLHDYIRTKSGLGYMVG